MLCPGFAGNYTARYYQMFHTVILYRYGAPDLAVYIRKITEKCGWKRLLCLKILSCVSQKLNRKVGSN